MRRVSLLTISSAALAVGVLLLGAVIGGFSSGHALTSVLVVAAGLVLAAGLLSGSPPALAGATVILFLTGATLPADQPDWIGLVAIGVAAAVSHELARVSIDLRRPTRLGPGLLGRIALRTGVAAAAGVVAALVAARIQDWDLPAALVPVALATAASLVAIPRLTGVGRLLDRASVTARYGLAGALSAVVIGIALLGAIARQDIEVSFTPSGDLAPASLNDGDPPPPPTTTPASDDGSSTRRLNSSIVTTLVLASAAAIVLLLVSGSRRNQVSLIQDPLDMGPEDPHIDIVPPPALGFEEEPIDLPPEVAAEILDDLSIDLTSEPDPGRAVRFAYTRAERRLGQLGIERRPAETEPELLVRALARLGDDGDGLGRLVDLFERARFSETPVPEQARTDALDALDRLRRRMDLRT